MTLLVRGYQYWKWLCYRRFNSKKSRNLSTRQRSHKIVVSDHKTADFRPKITICDIVYHIPTHIVIFLANVFSLQQLTSLWAAFTTCVNHWRATLRWREDLTDQYGQRSFPFYKRPQCRLYEATMPLIRVNVCELRHIISRCHVIVSKEMLQSQSDTEIVW